MFSLTIFHLLVSGTISSVLKRNKLKFQYWKLFLIIYSSADSFPPKACFCSLDTESPSISAMFYPICAQFSLRFSQHGECSPVQISQFLEVENLSFSNVWRAGEWSLDHEGTAFPQRGKTLYSALSAKRVCIWPESVFFPHIFTMETRTAEGPSSAYESVHVQRLDHITKL